MNAFQLEKEKVVLDGRLNEPVWSRAKPAFGMTERQPQPGQKAPIDFKFRVLYSENSLYFGIESSLLPGRASELRIAA